MERTGFRVFAAVALVAGASLGFELLQTRVLSALYFNNVVYMTVTIALLGFGLSGVLASILHQRLENPERLAAWCCAGLSVAILSCLSLASALPGALPAVNPIYKMIMSYFILVVPFVFAGGALSLTFMCHGRAIFGLYAADLTASALTAVLFSLLLRPLGAPDFAWACAGTALAGFALLAPAAGLRRAAPLGLAAALAAGFFLFGPKIVHDMPEPYKLASRMYDQRPGGPKHAASVWTTISKIDVFTDVAIDILNWNSPGSAATSLNQDNDFNTWIFSRDDVARMSATAKSGKPTTIPSLAYFLQPKPKDALVIGVGGGVDIVDAHLFGARNIDGAEINPATANLMKTQFADYAQWPHWPNVTLHNAEGRRFARLSDKKYDVIVMRGIDTYAALSSGAYVLSENYLYTVEAMRDYMNALKPDGVMAICRLFLLRPRESLRLANLFLTAAETSGQGAPSQRMMVLNGMPWEGTFIKRTPFTPAEVKRVAEKAAAVGYSWIYVPKVLGAEQASFEAAQFKRNAVALAGARRAYAGLAEAQGPAGRAAFAEAYPYRIDPVYDDRPFFFEYYKGAVSDTGQEADAPLTAVGPQGSFTVQNSVYNFRGPHHYVLYLLLAVTTLFSLLGMGVPLAVFEREGTRVPRAWSLIGFFSSLGLGFMFVEIGCMQWLTLYLGHPMYSLMVVLAALLFYAGAGSLLAGKLGQDILKKLRFGMIGSALLIPAWLLVMKYLIPTTERWPLGGRIGVVLLSLLPLGLCMGIPFATGLRYLADRHARFIPWAWGINGLTSVAASILAIILAMRLGFTAVVLLGAAIYLGGYVSFRRHLVPGVVTKAELLQPRPA